MSTVKDRQREERKKERKRKKYKTKKFIPYHLFGLLSFLTDDGVLSRVHVRSASKRQYVCFHQCFLNLPARSRRSPSLSRRKKEQFRGSFFRLFQSGRVGDGNV